MAFPCATCNALALFSAAARQANVMLSVSSDQYPRCTVEARRLECTCKCFMSDEHDVIYYYESVHHNTSLCAAAMMATPENTVAQTQSSVII